MVALKAFGAWVDFGMTVHRFAGIVITVLLNFAFLELIYLSLSLGKIIRLCLECFSP